MIFLANMQREIEQKKEQVEMETASKFYENNIKDKFKMFYLILKTQSLINFSSLNNCVGKSRNLLGVLDISSNI